MYGYTVPNHYYVLGEYAVAEKNHQKSMEMPETCAKGHQKSL